MYKLIIFITTLFFAIPVFGRDQSDIALQKSFFEAVVDTISSQPNKPANSVVNVKNISSQEPVKTVQHKTSAAATPVAVKKFTPVKYDFSDKTTNGDFHVIVIQDTENSFVVSFSAEAPIEQYQLMDSTTKNITAHENLNDKTDYTFNVQRPFEAKYILLLSMFKDDVITQNIIPLYKKTNTKTLN
jgi:hypothetical protein